MVDCGVSLHSFQTLQRKTSMAVVSATVCEAVHRAARECGVLLSEPVMRLEISCDPQHTGTAVSFTGAIVVVVVVVVLVIVVLVIVVLVIVVLVIVVVILSVAAVVVAGYI